MVPLARPRASAWDDQVLNHMSGAQRARVMDLQQKLNNEVRRAPNDARRRLRGWRQLT